MNCPYRELPLTSWIGQNPLKWKQFRVSRLESCRCEDDPWTRGKCGYKLIQYMACGLPVVASPVGVNCEIVEHGRNGYLAANEAEWLRALGQLRSEPQLSEEFGRVGRKRVESVYSLEVTAPRLADLLKSAAI